MGAPDGDDGDALVVGTDALDPGVAEPDDGFDEAGAGKGVFGLGAGRLRRGDTEA